LGNRVLVIAPSWVGDLVMSQPLLALLKRQEPNIHIDVLAPAWCAPIVSRMPEVDQLITSPFKHGVLQLAKRKHFALTLQKQQYARAYILPNSWKSAWIPYCLNIPLRTGWLGEARFGLLNDWRCSNKRQYPRMVQRYAALAFNKDHDLESMSIPHPKLQVQDKTVVATLTKYGLHCDGGKVLVLCPGASGGIGKCWPADYYAKVANQKIAEGYQVWLMGSKNDRDVIDTILHATAFQPVDLSAKVSLCEKIDLLSLASVVVSNDSGLLHVAAALEKPVIGIYGPTSPNHAPPLCDNATILSCFKPPVKKSNLVDQRIIRQIMPERVLASISEMT